MQTHTYIYTYIKKIGQSTLAHLGDIRALIPHKKIKALIPDDLKDTSIVAQ
jgi:hypothetical protein